MAGFVAVCGPEAESHLVSSGLIGGGRRIRGPGWEAAYEAAPIPTGTAEGDGVAVLLSGSLWGWESPCWSGEVRVAGSDASRVRHAFLARGPEAFASLRGEFSVVVLDSRDGTVHVARDVTGTRPLFYRLVGPRLWLATKGRALWGVEGAAGRVDPDTVRAFLAQEPRIGGSVCRGVARALPGHRQEFREVGETWQSGAEPTWRPPETDPGLGRIGAEPAARELGRILDRAVELRLSTRPAVLALSGGVDSGAILASLLRAGSGGKAVDGVSTLSIRFPDPAADEGLQLGAWRSRSPLPCRETAFPASPSLRDLEDALDASDGLAYPNVVVLRHLCREAARSGGKALLLGHGGDQWFTGSPRILTDLVLSGRPLAALATAGNLWASAAARSESLFRAAVVSPVRRRVQPRRYEREPMRDVASLWRRDLLWLLAFEQSGIVNDSAYSVAASEGLEPRYPLLDQELLDLVFSLPPELLVDGGEWKGLLRRTMDGLAPASVTEREGKADATSLFDRLTQEWRLRRHPGSVPARPAAGIDELLSISTALFLDRAGLPR